MYGIGNAACKVAHKKYTKYFRLEYLSEGTKVEYQAQMDMHH